MKTGYKLLTPDEPPAEGVIPKRHRPSVVSVYLDETTLEALRARARARGDPMRLIIETAIRLYLHVTPAVLPSKPKGITTSEAGRKWANLRWERARARRAERAAEGAKKDVDTLPEVCDKGDSQARLTGE